MGLYEIILENLYFSIDFSLILSKFWRKIPDVDAFESFEVSNKTYGFFGRVVRPLKTPKVFSLNA